jgi:ABC-type multidrug transport system fused ATPase/permease subunit
MNRLRQRNEWRFFGVLLRAHRGLALAWWLIAVLRGVLPAVFAVATGMVIRNVQQGQSLFGPLVVAGFAFVGLQILAPLHLAVGSNLGDRTASWLYDRLAQACLRPQGMAHLEDPKLTGDLMLARDFDLAMMGPPLFISMDFIAGGLVELIGGLASAILLAWYSWWAALLLSGAWLATHWLLRESAVWRDRNTDEVRAAQRESEYAYRIAVDPPAAKEMRLFGLAGWVIERFIARRSRLHALQYEATRLGERPLAASALIVTAANIVVFWRLAVAAGNGAMDLGAAVIFAQAALGTSMIAFGGLNWALDWAASPVGAVLRLEAAMAATGTVNSGSHSAEGLPRSEIRFRDVSFAYPGGAEVLKHFNLTIPAGSSLAIVGRNGAGKTTLAKLLCRLYDPQSGTIEIDGISLQELDLGAWRSRLAAVFQDFIRFELSLRDNVAPQGAPDDLIQSALEAAGAASLAHLDTTLARGYDGGIDLSGGQWQRIALARAICAVGMGARVVLLDEPTAQLDVRGESEIFDRILAITRQCTTILISHRFSTVRHADRICVLEDGAVVELGSHDELMALGGRYRTMFDLQAHRFAATEDEEGTTYDVLA